MRKFGQNINSKNNKLPIKIKGTIYPKPINYIESKASAQVKSCILLAAMKTSGITNIKCIPSRDHTEKLFLYLDLPIKIKKGKKFETITLNGKKNYKGFTDYIDIEGSCQLYFLTWENNDLKTLSSYKGPPFWYESEKRNSFYQRRHYKLSLFDLDGDGAKEVLVKHGPISKIYFYQKRGQWLKY